MKRFTVKGINTPFPIDMLRFDECYPESVEDSSKLSNTFGYRHGRRVRWTLTLVSERDTSPSVERWQSFAVEVVDVTDVETYKEKRARKEKEISKRSNG